ncbi:hypothetical protein PBAL39_15219 [Pedobacter sp. BAL39]|uniref:hypothetical protein n=1 Tax=Pedobacter sp. BAL39 TaxID=391596 RepID=UPI0001559BA4|nr:hypothetical protein [Pedobacter sp. BAL39]EDM37787.1 hypothetical protein PBAL39_15219 [Pedobacter sp. BAL39]
MYIKTNFKKLALLSLMAVAFTACKKDRDPIAPEPEDDHSKEYKYVRVLVSDELSTQLNLLDPFLGTTTAFTGKYPLANLYGTASGRYAAVLYSSQNLVEVFDSGLLSHDDHVDVDGQPQWASITATGIKPTHFKSKNTESLIFNDGDGTLSVGNDADFKTPGAKFSVVNAGLLPHHGAMAQFDNGTYAVTVAASAGASPNRVQIINKSGSIAHASNLEIGAIHGNASNGTVAVFGGFSSSAATAGGVLVVNASGEQRLIPNPEGFGAFRLASIYYAEASRKFIGYVATKGAYMIDIAGNKITPIYAGNDAFQCKVDRAGDNLLVLTLDGKLRIYNLLTGALKKEGDILSIVNSSDTYKPVLEATEKFAYVAVPSSGEVHQIDLQDFSKVIKHKVSSRPVRLTLFGFESSEGHND